MATPVNSISIVQVLKDFGWLINIGFISALFGIFIRIWNSTLKARDAKEKVLYERLSLADERLANAQEMSVENFADKIRAIKEIKEWYKGSAEVLSHLQSETENNMEDELNTRKELMAKSLDNLKGSKSNVLVEFEPINICGKWQVVGNNKLIPNYEYSGTLDITLKHGIIQCTWVFGHSDSEFGIEIYEGIGVINGYNLACNFHFESNDSDFPGTSKGVALFNVITTDIMRGVWTSTETKVICSEEARKIDSN